jgi:frataxin-like iron-binding protein CyaY
MEMGLSVYHDWLDSTTVIVSNHMDSRISTDNMMDSEDGNLQFQSNDISDIIISGTVRMSLHPQQCW